MKKFLFLFIVLLLVSPTWANVKYLVPDSNGTYTDWTGVYTAVDDTLIGTCGDDYVSTVTKDKYETYTIQDCNSTAWDGDTIPDNAVLDSVRIHEKWYSDGNYNNYIYLYDGVARRDSSVTATGYTCKDVYYNKGANALDSAAWTKTKVNALQVGVRSRGTNPSLGVNCYAIIVEVYYTPVQDSLYVLHTWTDSISQARFRTRDSLYSKYSTNGIDSTALFVNTSNSYSGATWIAHNTNITQFSTYYGRDTLTASGLTHGTLYYFYTKIYDGGHVDSSVIDTARTWSDTLTVTEAKIDSSYTFFHIKGTTLCTYTDSRHPDSTIIWRNTIKYWSTRIWKSHNTTGTQDTATLACTNEPPGSRYYYWIQACGAGHCDTSKVDSIWTLPFSITQTKQFIQVIPSVWRESLAYKVRDTVVVTSGTIDSFLLYNSFYPGFTTASRVDNSSGLVVDTLIATGLLEGDRYYYWIKAFKTVDGSVLMTDTTAMDSMTALQVYRYRIYPMHYTYDSAFATPASLRDTIEKPSGGGIDTDCVHIDVYYDPLKWNNHYYWAVYTPNNPNERVYIVYSDDGFGWRKPCTGAYCNRISAGAANSIDTDCDIIHSATNDSLYTIWRTKSTPVGASPYGCSLFFYISASGNGATWTTPVSILRYSCKSGEDSDFLSPALVWIGSKYRMYYNAVNGLADSMHLEYREATSIYGTWGARQQCYINGYHVPRLGADSRPIWHLDVVKRAELSRYDLLVLSSEESNSSLPRYALYYGYSNSAGDSFTINPNVNFMAKGASEHFDSWSQYRSSMIHYNDSLSPNYRLFYPGGNAGATWNIGHTNLYIGHFPFQQAEIFRFNKRWLYGY